MGELFDWLLVAFLVVSALAFSFFIANAVIVGLSEIIPLKKIRADIRNWLLGFIGGVLFTLFSLLLLSQLLGLSWNP